MPTHDAIELEQVHKRFGAHTALHPFDLQVPRGALCGLLGHNGAGKSTLMGILLGMVFPDGGHARIGGADVFRDRRRALGRVGAIFETPGFFPYLSGWTNLKMLCEYTAAVSEDRIRDAVRLVGLEAAIRAPVRTYSCGMRQRLALAQALLPDPDTLVLDEPGLGLDPEGYRHMRDTLRTLRRERGLTILLSSHLLAEVEQICTHVAVLRQGRLRYAGAWKPDSSGRIEVRADRQEEAARALESEGLVAEWIRAGLGRLAPGRAPADVTAFLVHRGFRVDAVRAVPPSLEDFYLGLSRDPDAEAPP